MTGSCCSANLAAALRTRGMALLGWLAVMAASLAFYDAMLLTSLADTVWDARTASARIAADTLRLDLALGVRFGKSLEHYPGLDRLLARARDRSMMPVAVLDGAGGVIDLRGDFPWSAWTDGEPVGRAGAITVREDPDGRTVFAAVAGRGGKPEGFSAARIEAAPVAARIRSEFERLLLLQAASVALGLALLAWVVGAFGARSPRAAAPCGRRPAAAAASPETVGRKTRRACLAVLLLVMTVNALGAAHTVGTGYMERSRMDARHVGLLLSETLSRLSALGVEVDRHRQLENYLKDTAAAAGGTFVLEIYDARNRRIAGSAPRDVATVGDPLVFAMAGNGRGRAQAASAVLQVSLLRAPWFEALRLSFLNLYAIAAIAFVLMGELSRLADRIKLWRSAARGGRPACFESAGLIRPLMFFTVAAIEMATCLSVLRMGEVIPAGTASREFVMGLVLSALMAGAALGTFAPGAWGRRYGAGVLLTAGMLLMGFGALAAWSSSAPWAMICAHALMGLGWGICRITGRIAALGRGRLADTQAGEWAGMLAGCMLGPMIAGGIGIRALFLIQAVALFVLAAMPVLFLSARHGMGPDPAAGGPRLDRHAVLGVLSDGKVLAFLLLIVLPGTLIAVGCISCVGTIWLGGQGIGQSDLGRYFLLRSLPLVFCGAWITGWIEKIPGTAVPVAAAVVCMAAATALAWVGPDLVGFSLMSLAVGVGMSLAVPAMGRMLLGLDGVQRAGPHASMAAYELVQRTGKILAPMAGGILLVFFPGPVAAAILGAMGLVLPLLFLLFFGVRRNGPKAS